MWVSVQVQYGKYNPVWFMPSDNVTYNKLAHSCWVYT